MSAVLASAADERYGYHLLNLIGSVKANSDLFDEIVVYDLGLSAHQRRLAARPGVEVRPVPPFVPHWAQCFTWKPWIWTQLDADEVFYLDAGTTVLRSLAPALEQIRSRGYFLVSQGSTLRDLVPPDYLDLYGLAESFWSARTSRPGSSASGPVATSSAACSCRPTRIASRAKTWASPRRGRHEEPRARRNGGAGGRDCRHFRWDQTILNIRPRPRPSRRVRERPLGVRRLAAARTTTHAR